MLLWTKFRFVSCAIIGVSVILGLSNVMAPNFSMALMPILLLVTRHHLRQLAEGIFYALSQIARFPKLWVIFLISWSFMGFCVLRRYSHLPDGSEVHFATYQESLYANFHCMLSRPTVLYRLRAVFEQNNYISFYFVALTVFGDILITTLVIALGNRAFREFSAKTLNRSLRYRYLAAHALFILYSNPVPVSLQQHKFTQPKEEQKADVDAIGDRYMSLEMWLAFCAEASPTLMTQDIEEQKLLYASEFLSEERNDSRTQIGLTEAGFFRMLGTMTMTLRMKFRPQQRALLLEKLQQRLFFAQSQQALSVARSTLVSRETVGTTLNPPRSSYLSKLFNDDSENESHSIELTDVNKSIRSQDMDGIFSHSQSRSTTLVSKWRTHWVDFVEMVSDVNELDGVSLERILFFVLNFVRERWILFRTTPTPPKPTSNSSSSFAADSTKDRDISRFTLTTARTVSYEKQLCINSKPKLEDALQDPALPYFARLYVNIVILSRKAYFAKFQISYYQTHFQHKLKALTSTSLFKNQRNKTIPWIDTHHKKQLSIRYFRLFTWCLNFLVIISTFLLASRIVSPAALPLLWLLFFGCFARDMVRVLVREMQWTRLRWDTTLNFVYFILLCSLGVDPESLNQTAETLLMILQSWRCLLLLWRLPCFVLVREISPVVGRVVVVYAMVVYAFAVLGHITFCSVLNSNSLPPTNDDASSWLPFASFVHFDSFGSSVYTVAVTAVLSNWSMIMDAAVSASSTFSQKAWTYIFFFTLRITLTMTIIPLLLSSIMQSFVQRLKLQREKKVMRKSAKRSAEMLRLQQLQQQHPQAFQPPLQAQQRQQLQVLQSMNQQSLQRDHVMPPAVEELTVIQPVETQRTVPEASAHHGIVRGSQEFGHGETEEGDEDEEVEAAENDVDVFNFMGNMIAMDSEDEDEDGPEEDKAIEAAVAVIEDPKQPQIRMTEAYQQLLASDSNSKSSDGSSNNNNTANESGDNLPHNTVVQSEQTNEADVEAEEEPETDKNVVFSPLNAMTMSSRLLSTAVNIRPDGLSIVSTTSQLLHANQLHEHEKQIRKQMSRQMQLQISCGTQIICQEEGLDAMAALWSSTGRALWEKKKLTAFEKEEIEVAEKVNRAETTTEQLLNYLPIVSNWLPETSAPSSTTNSAPGVNGEEFVHKKVFHFEIVHSLIVRYQRRFWQSLENNDALFVGFAGRPGTPRTAPAGASINTTSEEDVMKLYPVIMPDLLTKSRACLTGPQRIHVAAQWLRDAAYGRSLTYPVTSAQVYSLLLYRSSFMTYLLGIIAIAQMVSVFLIVPYCEGNGNVNLNSNSGETVNQTSDAGLISSKVLSIFDLLCAIVYMWELALDLHARFSLYWRWTWFAVSKRWLLLRSCFVCLILANCLPQIALQNNSVNEKAHLRLVRALFPVLLIARNEGLGDISRGLIRSVKRSFSVYLFFIILFIFFGMCGYWLFHRFETNNDRFGTIGASFLTILQCATAAPFSLFVIAPYYDISYWTPLFFLILTYASELLCISLIVGAGTVLFTSYADKTMTKRRLQMHQMVQAAYHLLLMPADGAVDAAADVQKQKHKEKESKELYLREEDAITLCRLFIDQAYHWFPPYDIHSFPKHPLSERDGYIRGYDLDGVELLLRYVQRNRPLAFSPQRHSPLDKQPQSQSQQSSFGQILWDGKVTRDEFCELLMLVFEGVDCRVVLRPKARQTPASASVPAVNTSATTNTGSGVSSTASIGSSSGTTSDDLPAAETSPLHGSSVPSAVHTAPGEGRVSEVKLSGIQRRLSQLQPSALLRPQSVLAEMSTTEESPALHRIEEDEEEKEGDEAGEGHDRNNMMTTFSSKSVVESSIQEAEGKSDSDSDYDDDDDDDENDNDLDENETDADILRNYSLHNPPLGASESVHQRLKQKDKKSRQKDADRVITTRRRTLSMFEQQQELVQQQLTQWRRLSITAAPNMDASSSSMQSVGSNKDDGNASGGRVARRRASSAAMMMIAPPSMLSSVIDSMEEIVEVFIKHQHASLLPLWFPWLMLTHHSHFQLFSTSADNDGGGNTADGWPSRIPIWQRWLWEGKETCDRLCFTFFVTARSRIAIIDIISFLLHVVLAVQLLSITSVQGAIPIGWIRLGYFLETCFWCEMGIRITALGELRYLQDPIAFFRVCINCASLLALCLVTRNDYNFQDAGTNGVSSALISLVAIQCLRVTLVFLRLRANGRYASTISATARALFLLAMALYFFAIFAQDRFCSVLRPENIAGETQTHDDAASSWNQFSEILVCSNYAQTLFTLFEVTVLGSWSMVMDAAASIASDPSGGGGGYNATLASSFAWRPLNSMEAASSDAFRHLEMDRQAQEWVRALLFTPAGTTDDANVAYSGVNPASAYVFFFTFRLFMTLLVLPLLVSYMVRSYVALLDQVTFIHLARRQRRQLPLAVGPLHQKNTEDMLAYLQQRYFEQAAPLDDRITQQRNQRKAQKQLAPNAPRNNVHQHHGNASGTFSSKSKLPSWIQRAQRWYRRLRYQPSLFRYVPMAPDTWKYQLGFLDVWDVTSLRQVDVVRLYGKHEDYALRVAENVRLELLAQFTQLLLLLSSSSLGSRRRPNPSSRREKEDHEEEEEEEVEREVAEVEAEKWRLLEEMREVMLTSDHVSPSVRYADS